MKNLLQRNIGGDQFGLIKPCLVEALQNYDYTKEAKEMTQNSSYMPKD